jgi:hypothetical protein
MIKRKNPEYALCFHCASMYTIPKSGKYVCPYCGLSTSKLQYHSIIEYASNAVYYGYNYRKKYEMQLQKKGKITVRYCLPDPSTIACFIGVAALSGIIGNVSYDLVKKIIQKILKNKLSESNSGSKQKIKLANKIEINTFIQFIREYHSNEFTTNSEVKYEIDKEQLINHIGKFVLPTLLKGNPKSKEIHNAYVKAIKTRPTKKKLKTRDFDNFWQKFE